MTRILIAGLGSIGRRHLRNLAALGESDVVLLRSHRSTLPDDELAPYPVETDLRQALNKHQPAAVIIANPTALHLEVALPAAETGCAILLEKPPSHSLDRLDSLQTAVSRTGAPVLVGFQLRFHPCLGRTVELISGGRLGRVIAANVHFSEYLPAWHPWEDYRKGYAARADLGGGVLLTQCHSLDYVPWLLGRVQEVWGTLAKLGELELDVEDTAIVGLRLVGGALAGLHIDYIQQPPSHRLEIGGTRGMLVCDLLGGMTRFYDADKKEWEEYALPEGWERNVMFMDEMRHFLAVIRGEVTPSCTLEDGVRVMQLISAIQASNESGRRISLTA
jgi:predicted dehydrogenase